MVIRVSTPSARGHSGPARRVFIAVLNCASLSGGRNREGSEAICLSPGARSIDHDPNTGEKACFASDHSPSTSSGCCPDSSRSSALFNLNLSNKSSVTYGLAPSSICPRQPTPLQTPFCSTPRELLPWTLKPSNAPFAMNRGLSSTRYRHGPSRRRNKRWSLATK